MTINAKKRIKPFRIQFFFIFLLLLSLFSCFVKKNTPGLISKMVVGTWQFENMITDVEIEESMREVMEEMIKTMLEDSNMTFHANHTYDVHFNEESSTGVWKLSSDGGRLVTTENETTDVYEILELTKDKMVIKTQTEEGSTATLYLKRK